MTPLPGALATGPCIAWRLDRAEHAPTWDSGQGAYLYPGRWHNAGFRMVYASFDPATTILEAAVHKGFDTLDRVPHVLSAFEIADPGAVRAYHPTDIPNPRWLVSAQASRGQRDWGQQQMQAHGFVALPSAVSTRSWNVIFAVPTPAGAVRLVSQEPLDLDTRLNAES